ncbi:MAG: SdrD B-like domain-containing protein [Caldilineaceae bacterium]
MKRQRDSAFVSPYYNHERQKLGCSSVYLHTTTAIFFILSLLLQPMTLLAASPALQVRAGAAVDPPILIAPENNATTTGANYPPLGVPKFVWEPVSGAERYHIEISNSAGFATTVAKDDTYATTYTPIEALSDGVYYWRVRAGVGADWGAYSDVASFTKEWSDGGALVPQLISPPDGATRFSFTNEDFGWSPVPGAASYLFEIGTDATFSAVVYSIKTIKPNHTPTTRLPNNLYYWRVTPVDYRGHFGTPSTPYSFHFDWSNPPQLLTPEVDASLAFVPSFAWTAVEAASSYELQISTQEDFSTLIASYKTVNTAYTPEQTLSNDQDYYWRVKAIDAEGNGSPWSPKRNFRMRWNFQAQLLAPINGAIKLANPVFSWTPIPGVERYQIQADESTSFKQNILDQTLYNVTGAAMTRPKENVIPIERDIFWRVRGIDAQDNYTPWSDLASYRYGVDTSPQLIYPLPYYTPDSENLPVHNDNTIAWPLFLWDSSVKFDWGGTNRSEAPAYYELAVSANPGFQTINFQLRTTGLAAAPTLENPFNNLVDGSLYYWRVRAYTKFDERIGVDHVFTTRVDRAVPQLPQTATITPIYPRDGLEVASVPPILGWQPVTNADHYKVQVSRDPNFNTIIDEATPQFVNHVPWQGRATTMPTGAYWWRVRAENSINEIMGGWSEVRRFDLSQAVLQGNRYDFQTPAYPTSILSLGTAANYDPAQTYVASSATTNVGQYELGDLHVLLNRVDLKNDYPNIVDNYNWIFAFGASATITQTLKYGLYLDTDHRLNSGATFDPLGKPITADELFLPEYAIYVERLAERGANPNAIDPALVTLYAWNGASWSPGQTLAELGSDAWFAADTNAVQLLVPYTAIGTSAESFSGSLAMTVFSTDSANGGAVATIPAQSGPLDNPAFVSNLLLPLYPFDTPLDNPMVHYDMPILRWHMPYYGSIDGYQLEIARDIRFTELVETWEFNEIGTESFFSFITSAFQSTNDYADNESYYWRVRLRHERYEGSSSRYDYGSWSPPMRFKLDSRRVGNPTLSTGELANTTPTFSWERVEGAAGYTIQIDNDNNFSSPVLNVKIDGTSYTPKTALPDGSYFWRVAMRRSDRILGHWTETMSFEKQSLSPTPLTPINGVVINEQPTFKWTAILTPTNQPRVTAPRYRLQLDDDPNFGSPKVYTTEATAYTLKEIESLADGTWYWRVAVIDVANRVGAYSATQQFYKEYLAPTLLQPGQNGAVTGVTSFEWQPVDGAAYYQIEIDDDQNFGSPTRISTDSTKYTPTSRFTKEEYFWRVRIYDKDRRPGPFETGRIKIQDVSLSLGNYVWIDSNNNGKVDDGEPPVPDGVLVELLDGSGASLDLAAPTRNGYYLFTGLDINEYRVRLAASNFKAGGYLENYGHSSGVGQENDPNSNGDQNDNGVDSTDPAVDGIVSPKIALGQDEPTGETPTASGVPGDDGAGTVDSDSNLTVDFGVTPPTNTYSLGNFVGADANADGQIDINAALQPVPVPDGVVVELLTGEDVSTGRTTTTVSGYYLFAGISAGDYRVRLAASNFAAKGLLENYKHSSGAGQELDPNNNGDQNDNGLDESTPAINGITSGIITLGDDEPTGETPTASTQPGVDGHGTPDEHSNLTVDFALVPGPPTSIDPKSTLYLPIIQK